MIKELVIQNRSYRGFNHQRKLTREELTELVDCARLTASSVNMQPFKYYIAWQEDEVAAIQAQTRWARGLPQIQLPHPGMEPTGFIVILQDTTIFEGLQRFQKDCGIVAQTMLLRAAEMGLGGCMIGNFSAGALKEILDLPEHLAPLLIIALGEPAEQIVLKEIAPGESTAYYRDERDIHYVPKRKLEGIVLSRK